MKYWKRKNALQYKIHFPLLTIFFGIFYFIITEWIHFDIYLTFWCRVNIWCRLRKKRSFSWLLASWCFSCSCCFSFSQIAASLPKWNHSCFFLSSRIRYPYNSLNKNYNFKYLQTCMTYLVYIIDHLQAAIMIFWFISDHIHWKILVSCS